jgi:hypothetical protein
MRLWLKRFVKATAAVLSERLTLPVDLPYTACTVNQYAAPEMGSGTKIAWKPMNVGA